MQQLRNNSLKIALMVFFGGFFIGYTARFFDVIRFPIIRGFLFPIYEQVVAAMEAHGGYPSFSFMGIQQQFEIEAIDVFKHNFFPAVLLIGTSILFGLPTMVLLFIIGVGAGSSFAEVIEFTPLAMTARFFISSLFFVGAMVYASSVGFHTCSYLLDTIRSREFKVEKTFYDHILITAGLVLFGIVVQYILLVS